MRHRQRVIPWGALALGLAARAGTKPKQGASGAGGIGVVTGSGGANGGGGTSGGAGGTTPPLPPPGDASTCMPVTCTPPGGRYCGAIGDGCNATIDCGACPSGQ